MTSEQHSSLDEIERHLQTARRLGVLTITLLQHEDVNYEGARQSISSFLSTYLLASMRRSDTLLHTGVRGNTQALFLGPPRSDRLLDLVDIAHVRKRLNNHMLTEMTEAVVEHYGVFVGASMVRRIRQISTQRVIQRGIESAFANAIGQRLRTVYQPIVDLTHHRTIGFEALTRVPLWKLERMSRHQALSTLPTIDTDQMLFLNIEADSFHDPELTSERFKQRLERAGISAGQVVFELTEHVRIKDFGELRSRLADYRKTGFRLAMDDVGAGHSGLQSIIELAPDFIKVDMSLVRDIDKHQIKQEMMAMIQSFADRTGCTLIAEGVERPGELAALTASGVRCAQGFLLAPPESRPRSLEWRRLMAMLG